MNSINSEDGKVWDSKDKPRCERLRYTNNEWGEVYQQAYKQTYKYTHNISKHQHDKIKIEVVHAKFNMELPVLHVTVHVIIQGGKKVGLHSFIWKKIQLLLFFT